MKRPHPILTAVAPLALAGGLLAGTAGLSPTPAGAATARPASPAPAVLTSTTSGAPGSYSTNLKGVCPSNVIIQTDWWPEADHGGLYQLIAPSKGVANVNSDSYSGPLGTTGVNLTLLAGGPAVGYQTVTSQLYANQNILLGQVGTDEAIQLSATQPTTAVFASYEKNPQIFFWGNPNWHFTTVKQIGQTNHTVLAFQATYLNVFEKEGLLKASQVDTSYQGNPSRFVADSGNIVSQGFIDDEPYTYEHNTPGWNKPVHVLSVASSYPVYQNALVVRSGALQADAPCLTKLVPILQQAEIDYTKNPVPTNEVIYNFANQLKGGAQLTLAGSNAAVKTLLANGIIANGTNGVFGSFNSQTVQSLITTLKPIFAAQNQPIKAGLTPTDIATNQFLNPNIKL